MGLFSLKLWKKLTAPRTANVDSAWSDGEFANATRHGLRQSIVLTNPWPTYATILDISGRGYLLNLEIAKPVTMSPATVRIRITLDGEVIANDKPLFIVSTIALIAFVVGQAQLPDSPVPVGLPPVFLPFNRSLKIEARYDLDPGGNEDITAYYFAVYN